MQFASVRIESFTHASVALFNQTHNMRAAVVEGAAGAFRMFREHGGEAFARCLQIGIKRFAVHRHGFVETITGFVDAAGEAVTTRGNRIRNARAGFIKTLGNFIAAHAQIHDEGFAGGF